MLLLSWLISLAAAVRPTEGGMYSFDSSDVVDFVDYGQIRVHYSSDGPNIVRAGDEDANGVPDFAEQVAQTADEVLDFYQGVGFQLPLTEAEMGLSELGGSAAFDFYLVDFATSADGMFGIDRCDDNQCSGYMVMENDFYGYSYPSIEEAIRVLTSHELFHGVQAAYNANQPLWMSEGMAVWAEHIFDPANLDFYAFCDAYLEDTGRSINRPPAGFTTAWSYGTALFFAFLEAQHGIEAMVSIQEKMLIMEDDEAVDAIVGVVEESGSTIEQDWFTFAQWNLASGERAGIAPSYLFAAQISGIYAEIEGSLIEDQHRFYPLAASYFRVNHPGDMLHFTADSDSVTFALHSSNADGSVGEAISIWFAVEEAEQSWDLPAGSYWLIGSQATNAEQSVRMQFCLGSAADCGPSDELDEDEETESKASCSGCAAHHDTSAPMVLWLSAFSLIIFRRNQKWTQ